MLPELLLVVLHLLSKGGDLKVSLLLLQLHCIPTFLQDPTQESQDAQQQEAPTRVIVTLSLTDFVFFFFEAEWERTDCDMPESMREAMCASQWMFCFRIFFRSNLVEAADGPKHPNQPEGSPTKEAKIFWCCDVIQFAILVPVPV